MPFLPPNQQRQSTEGNTVYTQQQQKCDEKGPMNVNATLGLNRSTTGYPSRFKKLERAEASIAADGHLTTSTADNYAQKKCNIFV